MRSFIFAFLIRIGIEIVLEEFTLTSEVATYFSFSRGTMALMSEGTITTMESATDRLPILALARAVEACTATFVIEREKTLA